MHSLNPVPADASDSDLIALIDNWASFLESERYEDAFPYTDHVSEMRWTPALMREVIKGYGEGAESQTVTLAGQPTDIVQRKEVTRWDRNSATCIGEIWYGLNIDGLASDLTATFFIESG